MSKQRNEWIDSIRGITLISMILFHTCWDLVYLFEVDFQWYLGTGAYVWQQSICWTFILLSGFCWSLGRKPFKRGMTVFICGWIITLVTVVFMPQSQVVFGILTLIGSCMLITIPLHKAFIKIPPIGGILGSFFLFVVTRNINMGYLGFEGINFLKLPRSLYQDGLLTFAGFTSSGFYSTDYFSLIPWIFLFLTGYFLYRILNVCDYMDKLPKKGLKPLSFIGKYSLPIYMIHQPFIYGILAICF